MVAASAVASEALAPALSASEAGPGPSAAASAPAPVTAAVTSEAPVGVLQVRTSEPSWSRSPTPAATLSSRASWRPAKRSASTANCRFACASATPAATRVSFRGQPMELAAYTRDNVARFELK